MDFDPRWSDDPRDRDDYGRELSQVSTRGGRGGGPIAGGPAAHESIGMMVAEVHGQSSLHCSSWLRSLIAANTCAECRVFVGRRFTARAAR